MAESTSAIVTSEITPGEGDVNISNRRILQLESVAKTLEAELPEFEGMTLFGSTARGEAKEDSDVDLFVFIMPTESSDIQNNSGYTDSQKTVRLNGVFEGTVSLQLGLASDYHKYLSPILQQEGINHADITFMPLDDVIAEQATRELLDTAREWDEGDHTKGAMVPRNIRGLFHVPLGNGRLRPYIEQVFSTLSASPHGDTAWKMIRVQLIGFEKRRDQEHYESVSHRNIPATLDEARELYQVL